MINRLYLLMGLALGIHFNSFSSDVINANDSLRNEITFSNDGIGSNSYSIKYSYKLYPNLWIKAGLIADGKYTKAEPEVGYLYTTSQRNLSFGIILGADKHANISVKGLDFVYGTHLRFLYYNEKSTTENPMIPADQRTITNDTYKIGIGFTLGLYYNFSDKFAIGSELNPYIDYWYTNNNEDYGTKYKGYEYNIFGNVSIISLKFRW